MKQKIKLAIFDLDGVITSTTEEHFEAWTLLFKNNFNNNLDQSLEVYTKGVSRIESFEVLLKHSNIVLDDKEQIEKLANEKNDIYKDLISEFNESHTCEGVIDILNYLKQNDIKIALGSASKNAPFLLKKLNLESYFDYVVNPVGKQSKPAPDIFSDAVDHFGYDPKEVIAFEDSKAGVKAIKNAKVFAIGVGEEDLSEADMHVKSLIELDVLTLDKIIKKINQ